MSSKILCLFVFFYKPFILLYIYLFLEVNIYIYISINIFEVIVILIATLFQNLLINKYFIIVLFLCLYNNCQRFLQKN